MDENNCVNACVDMGEIDEATQKADRLNVLLQEASSLLYELASKGINFSVNVRPIPNPVLQIDRNEFAKAVLGANRDTLGAN